MKKAYIGRAGSGKTTKLLQDLAEAKDNQAISEDSTLVVVLKSELEAYKKILPNATYCICEREEFECVNGSFKTLVVDSGYLSSEQLLKLDIAPDGQLPENVFWTFQGGMDMSLLFPNLDEDVKYNLLQIDRDVSSSTECFVIEVEK